MKHPAIIKAANAHFRLPKGDGAVDAGLVRAIAEGRGDDSHPVHQFIAALLNPRRKSYPTGKKLK